MNIVVQALVYLFLLLFSWIGLRLLYCVYNYKVYKYKLRHLPAFKNPWARLKGLMGDPSTELWDENISLVGKGNAFQPIVFIGPYIDMGRPVVMVNSPELIREVSDDTRFPKLPAYYDPVKTTIGNGIITESGEHWRELRDMLNPLFFHNKIKQFGTHMTANADELIAILKPMNGAEVNCLEILSETTLKVLLDCIFSRKDFEPKWTAGHLKKSGDLILVFAFTEFLFGTTLNSIFPWSRVINNTRKTMYDRVGVLCERARNTHVPDEEASLLETLVSIKKNGKQVLSDTEIADEALNLLFAGYDTTKNLIAWTLYFLCLDRKELEKVHSEVDRVLQGRTATYDDIPNLTCVKNALLESLRLRPAAAGLERHTPKDTVLGGHFIPKGTTIYMNWHGAHTDPTLWEKPEIYYPDRYNDNAGYAKSFFAFSFGPRSCLGQKFAISEAVIITASLLQQFDVQMGSGKVRVNMNISQEALGFTCKFIPRL